MAEFRKILISGSNVYGRELYASQMSDDSDSSLNVVLWNSSNDRFYITGTYANAGTSASFEGDYQGDINLTVEDGATTERLITIGKDRDTAGDAKLILSTGSANNGLEILREGSTDGDTKITHRGTGNIEFALEDGASSGGNVNKFTVQRSSAGGAVELMSVFSNGDIFFPQLTNANGGFGLTFIPSTGQVGYSVSTRRVKTDIKPLNLDLLGKFDQLNPVTFNYISDPNIIEAGFIAEEIADVDPLLAKWGPSFSVEEGRIKLDETPLPKEVPHTLADRAILAIIVAKIQELDKKIEELKKLKRDGSV